MVKTIMTTDRRPMSGRGRDNSISKLDSYNKASIKGSTGTFMRTFSRTKTSQLVTAWDDTGYLTAMNHAFKFVGDVTSAVDSATVPNAPMTKILDLAWETHFVNANLKDLVAGDETSWQLYFTCMLQICMALQIQYNFRTLLPAYAESDTTPGSAAGLAYFTQSSFDIFVASMKQYPVPKGVYNIVNLFGSWVVKMAPEYEKHTLRIPPAYLAPFVSAYDLADLEAMRNILRVNLGGAITHAKKYGLGMGSWSDPKAPTIKSVSDPDVIAYFNHSHINFYDNQPAQQPVNPNGGFMGANLTTNYTGVEYFFKDTPNESPIHVLAPWFGTYNDPNNLYGGLITVLAANAAEYSMSAIEFSQHDTALSTVMITDDGGMMLLNLFKCVSDSNSAVFQVSVGGTNFTASQVLDGSWPLAVTENLFMGANRGAVETNNDLINYIGKSLI